MKKVWNDQPMRAILHFGFVLLFVAFCSREGHAQAPQTGEYYQIIAKHSGKALDVKGGTDSKRNGAQFIQWDAHGAANQLFKLKDKGNGYYMVIAKHSGKALDVRGGTGAKKNGAVLHQWEPHGGDNQLFRLVEKGNGYYMLVAKHSGKAVDVSGGERDKRNGIKVHQWDVHGQGNQLFKFVSVNKPSRDLEARGLGPEY